MSIYFYYNYLIFINNFSDYKKNKKNVISFQFRYSKTSVKSLTGYKIIE